MGFIYHMLLIIWIAFIFLVLLTVAFIFYLCFDRSQGCWVVWRVPHLLWTQYDDFLLYYRLVSSSPSLCWCFLLSSSQLLNQMGRSVFVHPRHCVFYPGFPCITHFASFSFICIVCNCRLHRFPWRYFYKCIFQLCLFYLWGWSICRIYTYFICVIF